VLNKRLGAIILVPVRAKREKLLDSDDKKARLSVKIAIALHTPSSYFFDAKASRGRTRIFFANSQRDLTEPLPTIRNPHFAQAAHRATPTQTYRPIT
jgi:hypothetical protein